MKAFYWNFRYAYWMHRRVGLTFRFCWDAAIAAADAYSDGMTPRDAVDTELSYWTDD